jgi:predicted acyltransferase
MPSPTQSVRLRSLDAFRGITIAGMILVNTASLSQTIHPWLAHSSWNGCTLADLVFPFFLFITGVAMAFSLAKYNQENKPTLALYWRLLRRGVILFALGLIINGFWTYEWGTFQITGVLQRISLAYLATALIVLNLPRKGQWGVTVLLLIGYWAAYVAFPIPEPKYEAGNLTRHAIGTFGIMSLFDMMPTIANVLMGYFTGIWLRTEAVATKNYTSSQSISLILFGLSSILLGQLWSLLLPINKKLWTSSYELFTVGLALLLLAAFYELIEVRSLKRWSYPLQILGLNSIFVFVGSELLNKLLETIRIGSKNDAPSSYIWLSQHLFSSWAGGITSGFLLALITLLFWWLIAYCLYWRRWLITI